MARFGNATELATFLGKLDADYAEYAPALWQKGIKTPRQLANFSEPHYLACDVPEGHIDDIKARADTTGELLPCILYISIHVVLGTASMWLKGLQLVAELSEGVVTKKSSSIHTASRLCLCLEADPVCMHLHK